MKLVVHIIIGIIITIMLAGILVVLSLPISGATRLTLAVWGILLAIIGAIIGALIGAKRREKS